MRTIDWLILLNLGFCALNTYLGNYASATLSAGAFIFLSIQRARE